MNSFQSYKKKLDKVKDIEGYLVPGQEKGLMVLASTLPNKATIVEIGSFKGRSTACLALGSKENVIIYAIDTFEGNNKDFSEGAQFMGGNFYADFVKNIKSIGKSKKVIAQNGLSSEIGKKWKKKIDFLFIDGSHIYEDVKRDFELFYPWVKGGGIIAFHDVHPNFPGVLKVWEKNAKEKLIAYSNIHTLYFGIKPKKGMSKKTAQNIVTDIEEKIKIQKVFVIIPVFNRIESTIKCLKSFKNQDYKNFEVIVVDDGSTDGTSRHIKRNYPEVKLIRGNGNWWWTRSMFEGVKKAMFTAEENDFILTMNNDCYFGPSYIKSMVKASQENHRAITGSLILSAEKPNKVIDAGVLINWENAMIFGFAEKVSTDLKFYINKGTISDFDTLPGKGTLVPIEVIEKVGNFNYKALPHYIADYEFFCRAKKAGFKLIISSKSLLYNFTLLTGKSHLPQHRTSYKEAFSILFGRKSKLNIIDHTRFLLLCCPKKYLWKNFNDVFQKLIIYSLMVFPLYYIKIFIELCHKSIASIRLLIHNLPIMIRQNKTIGKIRLLIHNIPIYLRQNRFSKTLFHHQKIYRRN